jgi:hypothetical protein
VRRPRTRTIWGFIALAFAMLWVSFFIAGMLAPKKGADCNVEGLKRMVEAGKGTERPLNPQDEEELIASADAYHYYRLHIRGMDLPTLEVEQAAYVDALEMFIQGLLQHIASGSDADAVNQTVIPLGEADDDFKEAFQRECL